MFGGPPHTHTVLLDKVKSNFHRLIVSLLLLAVFYFFLNSAAALQRFPSSRYFHPNYFSELVNALPPTHTLFLQQRFTQLLTFFILIVFISFFARVNQLVDSFIPSTGKLLNCLVPSILPLTTTFLFQEKDIQTLLSSSLSFFDLYRSCCCP